MAFINEAPWDRVLRIVLGVAFLYIGLGGVAVGVWSAVFIVAGAIALATGAIGWCGLYAALGISTR